MRDFLNRTGAPPEKCHHLKTLIIDISRRSMMSDIFGTQNTYWIESSLMLRPFMNGEERIFFKKNLYFQAIIERI